jgi:hypothetical protein
MEHFICRCEHCGTSYTYCTYGNDDGCTKQYCGVCATAIRKALREIPQKYTGAKQKIEDESKINEIVQIFDKEKERFESSNFIKMSKVIPDWEYEKVECCYIDKTEYYRCTDKNGNVDIYALMEYDIINKNFTGKKYFVNNNPHRQYLPMTQMKFDTFNKAVKVAPMDKPTGKLFFDYIEWDITPFNKSED